MKTRQEFIIDTLKPYFINSSTRGVRRQGGVCVYLSDNGNKCPIGIHMKRGEWQQYRGTASTLFNRYKMADILTDEALEQKFSITQWHSIQRIHDNMIESDHLIEIEDCENECAVNLSELKELQKNYNT